MSQVNDLEGTLERAVTLQERRAAFEHDREVAAKKLREVADEAASIILSKH
jgi:hypothetical protein